MLIGLTSCIKQESGQFQLEYDMPIELPADANPILTHKFELSMPSNFIQFLNANHLSLKDIKKIQPRSIKLTPVFDNAINYDIISEGRVSVYLQRDPNGILQIANIDFPVGNPAELFFLPGIADVKSIISEPEFVMRLLLNIKVTPGSVSDHHLTVQFDVFIN